MKPKQVWFKSIAIALFVALATFTSTSLVFADHSECRDVWSARASGAPESYIDEICPLSSSEIALEAAAASPYVLSPLSWVTEGSNIPADILNEIRFVTNREVAVASAEVPGFVPSGLSWVTESSNIPAEILNEIQFLTNKEVVSESAVVAPSAVPSDLNIPEDILQKLRFWAGPEAAIVAPSAAASAMDIPEVLLQKLRSGTSSQVTERTFGIPADEWHWDSLQGSTGVTP